MNSRSLIIRLFGIDCRDVAAMFSGYGSLSQMAWTLRIAKRVRILSNQ